MKFINENAKALLSEVFEHQIDLLIHTGDLLMALIPMPINCIAHRTKTMQATLLPAVYSFENPDNDQRCRLGPYHWHQHLCPIITKAGHLLPLIDGYEHTLAIGIYIPIVSISSKPGKPFPMIFPIILLLHENPIRITQFHRGAGNEYPCPEPAICRQFVGHVQSNTVATFKDTKLYGRW